MERAYPRNAVSAAAPRVFGDGSAAVLHVPSFGDGGNPGGGFYQLDFTTGAFKRLFSRDDAGRVRSSVFALSPDNRTLYLGVVTGSPSRWSAVVAAALDSGLERRIMRSPRIRPACPGNCPEPRWQDAGPTHQRRTDIRGRCRGWQPPRGGHIVAGRRVARGRPVVSRWALHHLRHTTGSHIDRLAIDARAVQWRCRRACRCGLVKLSRPGRLMRFEFSPDSGRVAVSVRNQPRFDVGAITGLASGFRAGR